MYFNVHKWLRCLAITMSESEIETKREIDNSLQCVTCLSFGRKMLTIGDNSCVFKTLVSDFSPTQSSVEETLICWECHSILRKLAKFQNQVRRANQILQSGQSHIYGTLSCLTTVVKADTEPHTIYFNESSINVKQEDFNKHYSEDENVHSPLEEYSKESDDTITDSVFDSTVKDEIIDKKEETEPIKVNNKWSKKRALQNKKPKFKILKAKEVNVDTVLKRKLESKSMKKIECLNCDIGFDSENLLMEHFKKVHEKELVCDVCFLLVPNKEHLSAHLETHTERFECSLCENVYNNEILGRRHLLKVHNKIFRCIQCELMFASRREFFQHYKEWHEKFTCDYCGVTFKMRYCIKDHIRKQHSPYECKPCNKRFARYNGLWLHNKVRHGPPAQTAYCVECDKRYPDIYRYKWHLANSVKHKPRKKVRIPCPDCDKVFTKNIYMKDHYNLVHLKQYKYRCEDCDKNFIRNADLVKHKKRVHEGILPPKNKICYMCGRGFTTNKILTNHLRTHTGERPFACGSCPARFAQRTALASHARALHHSGRNDTS